jgi:hypothetical protein
VIRTGLTLDQAAQTSQPRISSISGWRPHLQNHKQNFRESISGKHTCTLCSEAAPVSSHYRIHPMRPKVITGRGDFNRACGTRSKSLDFNQGCCSLIIRNTMSTPAGSIQFLIFCTSLFIESIGFLMCDTGAPEDMVGTI